MAQKANNVHCKANYPFALAVDRLLSLRIVFVIRFCFFFTRFIIFVTVLLFFKLCVRLLLNKETTLVHCSGEHIEQEGKKGMHILKLFLFNFTKFLRKLFFDGCDAFSKDLLSLVYL